MGAKHTGARSGLLGKENIKKTDSQLQHDVKAAKRVYGVKAVVDEIEVKLPGSSERTDTDIAAAAVRVLKNNLAVPHDKIQVTVREGWITLEGRSTGSTRRLPPRARCGTSPG